MTTKTHTKRNAALAIGGTVVALGAAAAGFMLRRKGQPGGEHAAPDLALDQPHPDADHRAPEAFRPDPTATPSKGELDGLRPATGTAPGFAADRGTTVTEPVGA